MALKDWKKIVDNPELIRYNEISTEGYKNIQAFRINKGALVNKWWVVLVTGKIIHQFPINQPEGLTKQRALSFMKSYMRSH